MEDQIIQTSMEIILPVMEKATLLAAEYTKACGRQTLTAQDMKYALMYCSRNEIGKTIGIPDMSSSSSDDEEDMETVDEEDEPFTRYSGDDPLMNAVNEAHDTWSQWEPQNPAEQMLKNAVDKNMYSG